MDQIIDAVRFEEEVLKSEMPVLVDFFATWCGPCKMIAPTLEELSGQFDGKAKIVKIDVDQANDLAKNYGVRSIPTLVFFKGGKPVDTVVGALPKADIAARLDKML
ncbi:MAG: thioredoxin [Clostridiales bacterium]|jgi:thioredoxin 1|nr:thioredoxin [Clostridiales bacterium]